MTLDTCEKSPVCPVDFSPVGGYAPRGEILHLLVFAIGGNHFAIDLTEMKDVVREACLRCTDTATPSIVTGVIRRNRRNTIVVDLNRCLRIQWGFEIDDQNTGILILDDKIDDSNLGILVTGISSIATVKHSRRVADPGLQGDNAPPIHGVIQMTGPGTTTAARSPVIWIDTRSLVNRCSSCDPLPTGDQVPGE